MVKPTTPMEMEEGVVMMLMIDAPEMIPTILELKIDRSLSQ